jgi:hypothetical protein
MFVPTAITEKTPQINAIISQAMAELYPSVQQIRFRFGQDWTGDWATYFLVLLSDEASKPEDHEIGPRVVHSIANNFNVVELGMFPHFNFRSQSEQAKLQEPAWA